MLRIRYFLNLTVCFSIFSLTTVLLSQPEGWSTINNPSSGTFLGQATIDGIPAVGGDWSAAFDEDGNIAGAAEIIINAGTAYINMPIYGDDTTTPDVDEGMNAGESFILKIWDSSTGDILEYPESFDQWSNENGGVMPAYSDWEAAIYDFTSSGGGGNTIVPDENYFGDLTVPVFVDDGEAENSQSNTFDLLVTVTSVNDAPVLVDAIDDVQVEEDSAPIVLADLDDVFMDIDSDLSFTFSNDNESLVTVTIDGDNAVTLTFTGGANGTANLTFTADDGEFTVTDEVLVTVTPVNDPPEITGQDELFTPEETPLTITLDDLYVEDIDNTYPDDFTLTVLEGDNYTIEGGSGSNDNSEANPFEGLVISNPSSGTFFGQATIDGTSAGEGDWSAAFDEDGNIAGAGAIIINAGTAYINMPIYGDDPTTDDFDEGMGPGGEYFTLRLWVSSSEEFINYSDNCY